MHGAQTLGVRGDQAANDNDLKSHAISAARLIQFRSSHRRAGQSCVAIASAPAGRRNNETDLSGPLAAA